jgi:alpha-mannosidase
MRHWKDRLFVLLSCGFFSCQLVAQFVGVPPKIWHERYPNQMERLNSMTFQPLTTWRYHTTDVPHGEDPSLNDSSWNAVGLDYSGRTRGQSAAQAGQSVAQEGQSRVHEGWYRATYTVPSTVGGQNIAGARLRMQLRLSSDGRVFLNGGLVAQGEGRILDPILLMQKAVPGQTLQIAVRTPFHEDEGRLLGAQVLVDFPNQPDPGFIRTEIQTAEAAIAGFPEGQAQRIQQLDKAVNGIDFAALDHNDQAAFTKSLAKAEEDMQPINAWMKQYKVRLVGNSHIDMAWLWPWTETVQVVHDTFRTALQLINEYPNFIYTQSSVRDFEWLRDKYPGEFNEIKKRVKEGRWELVGGMWVEPDLNMPDGESMVRQILVGKRWFQKEFNVDVNIGWNPDTFGYTWQLPQIYKKSGFDTFVTQKLGWNETTVFPHRLFYWQSPDGSSVLTYFPHTYSGTTEPVTLANDVGVYAPQTHFPEIMHLYGVGDHGGGPTRQDLDRAVILEKPETIFPKAEFSTARAFFDDVKHAIDNDGLKLPTWNGELYLEYHRGCFTTQSETKKQIRHNEEMVENAEKFNALSFLTTKSPYSNKQFEDIWKRVLFADFHDIMPGSGVGNNYVEVLSDLNDANNASAKLLNSSLNNLTANIDTHGAGVPFVVFNPLSWERTSPVTVSVHTPAAGQKLEAVDDTGKALLTQTLSADSATARTRIEVMVPNVPSMGYRVIHVRSVEHVQPVASLLKVNGLTAENEFFRVQVDSKTGCINSLVEKATGKETVAPGGCGGMLQTFVDKPARQDAWEISFDGKSWDLKDPESVKLIENGPERAVIEIRNKFQNSDFVRDLVIQPHVARIDVHTRVNWHEEHILLKAGFPVNAQATKATYEIPYGTIERPTTRNTPAEKAMFEVPAQRWGDISDSTVGVSLLNDSKYGYDGLGNTIRLSLLRSPNMPAPDGRIADQGYHEFTWSLYPHTGNWERGGTMRQGFELNYPLMPIAAEAHTGTWPTSRSFVTLNQDNVILTALKKAEDSDALIYRFYEFAGKQTQVHLQLANEAATAFETNLMEVPERALELQPGGRELVVPTGPFEIKTVKVSFNSAKR